MNSDKRLFVSHDYVSSAQQAAFKYTSPYQVFRFAVPRFCAGVIARVAAALAGISHNSAILFFHKLSGIIFEQLALETPELFSGEIEVGAFGTALFSRTVAILPVASPIETSTLAIEFVYAP